MARTTYKTITYRETAKGDVEKYGLVMGMKEARKQAESLLDHLRIEGGRKRAKVWIDGRAIKRAYDLSLQNRDYFKKEEQPTQPQTSVLGVEPIKVLGKAAGLFGLRQVSGEYTVLHLPTKLILYVATTSMDAEMVAREVSLHCRKGIDSQDPDQVCRSLPRDYGEYLAEREPNDSYLGWSL